MIVLSDVTKNYGKFKALNGVSVSLDRGECIALIGPNGSGKSTLMKSLLGLVKINQGTMKLDGMSIVEQWKYREKIGYMPQNGRYPDHMTVHQVIEMMIDLRGVAAKDQSLLDRFHVHDFYEKTMSALSGGMRQKVNACLAFLFDPEVYFLDEPTAGLDPVSVEILKRKILEERRKGKLIIITSHVISDLEELITRVIYMQDGQIHFSKTKEELLDSTGEMSMSKALAKTMGGV